MFFQLIKLIGGIVVFSYGLRLIGTSADNISNKGVEGLLYQIKSNSVLSSLLGILITAFSQSSVASNIIVISFVNNKIMSLASACAFEIGSNIGSTLTAQLVSLSFANIFDINFLGSFMAIIGFCLIVFKGGKYVNFGNILFGFSFVFLGIELISSCVAKMGNVWWFKSLFLIKSPPILLLNGFFITALCQSSSVVSTMIIILASKSGLNFSSAVYLILGANIGTCLPVIYSANKKSQAGKEVAMFNLIFNIFGVILFIVLDVITKGKVVNVLANTSNLVPRQIANFHSIFNIVSGVIALLVLNPFIKLTSFITSKIYEKPCFKRGGKEKFCKIKNI